MTTINYKEMQKRDKPLLYCLLINQTKENKNEIIKEL